ncbi:MAG: hypothetical protein JWO87_3221 [Phycisphaerales bacterium]|jgi:hypothetical protein|nr:hypothetical protein [Phycisphaerales bacterium]
MPYGLIDQINDYPASYSCGDLRAAVAGVRGNYI